MTVHQDDQPLIQTVLILNSNLSYEGVAKNLYLYILNSLLYHDICSLPNRAAEHISHFWSICKPICLTCDAYTRNPFNLWIRQWRRLLILHFFTFRSPSSFLQQMASETTTSIYRCYSIYDTYVTESATQPLDNSILFQFYLKKKKKRKHEKFLS